MGLFAKICYISNITNYINVTQITVICSYLIQKSDQ